MAWRDEQKKVQFQIEQLSKNQEEESREIQQLKIELAVMKAKSVFAGGASGGAVFGVLELISYLVKNA